MAQMCAWDPQGRLALFWARPPAALRALPPKLQWHHHSHPQTSLPATTTEDLADTLSCSEHAHTLGSPTVQSEACN